MKFHTGGDETKDRAVPKALQGFLRKPSEHSSKKSIPIFSTRSADRGRAGGKRQIVFPVHERQTAPSRGGSCTDGTVRMRKAAFQRTLLGSVFLFRHGSFFRSLERIFFSEPSAKSFQVPSLSLETLLLTRLLPKRETNMRSLASLNTTIP